MTLTKSKRLERLRAAWWINDWSSKIINNKNTKAILPVQEYPSNIILKSNEESIAMIKTKSFLSESLNSSKDLDGTIIVSTSSSNDVPEMHEILLNIQPLGWTYILRGRKNEKQ